MRRTIPRLAVALGLAAAALRAPAHEVDCAKLAALAVPRADGSGLPILDPGGLPSLATSPGPILTMDRYPAVVAFDVQIRNLASEPSVISGVADTLPSDPTRVTGRGRRGGAAGPTAAALAAPRALEGAGAPLAPPARRGRARPMDRW